MTEGKKGPGEEDKQEGSGPKKERGKDARSPRPEPDTEREKLWCAREDRLFNRERERERVDYTGD